MTDDSFRAVTPIRPAVAYVGGKRRLGEQLARRIEAVPQETYCRALRGHGRRVFPPALGTATGSGQRRRDVVSHPAAALSAVHGDAEFQIASRVEFAHLAASNPDMLTDLERVGGFFTCRA